MVSTPVTQAGVLCIVLGLSFLIPSPPDQGPRAWHLVLSQTSSLPSVASVLVQVCVPRVSDDSILNLGSAVETPGEP